MEQWATASKTMQYNGTMAGGNAARAHEVMNARLGWMVTPGERYGLISDIAGITTWLITMHGAYALCSIARAYMR